MSLTDTPFTKLSTDPLLILECASMVDFASGASIPLRMGTLSNMMSPMGQRTNCAGGRPRYRLAIRETLDSPEFEITDRVCVYTIVGFRPDTQVFLLKSSTATQRFGEPLQEEPPCL